MTPRSPLALGGLASGIDTDSIITQLMAVEGMSKTRLQLADTRAVARQTGLRDLATKLGALRDAANALKSTTTWADVQQLTSSDPRAWPVRASAGAAPGARSIEVTALAVTAQHAFDYTASASPQTIAIGAFSLAIDPDSTLATVAAAINDRDDSPVDRCRRRRQARADEPHRRRGRRLHRRRNAAARRRRRLRAGRARRRLPARRCREDLDLERHHRRHPRCRADAEGDDDGAGLR